MGPESHRGVDPLLCQQIFVDHVRYARRSDELHHCAGGESSYFCSVMEC